MRIAVYVQDLRASGVVRMATAVARDLHRRGDDVTLLAGYGSGPFGAADVAPARLQVVAARPGRNPRAAVVPALRRTLAGLAPDVVLSPGNFGHFSLWAATRGLGLPLVYCFSNPMIRPGQRWRNRWRLMWGRLLIGGAARVILVGRAQAADPVFGPALASGRALVIPNGIELDRAARAGPVPALLTGEPPVVLSIGRLQPQKNFEALIDAVGVANRTRPLRLVILGTGTSDFAAALAARAAARGLGDRFVLAGTTDDVFAWLRGARVFALASRWEGSSIALLEALAAGVPIVANRGAGDAADVLGDGCYGLLVDSADSAAFAVALLRQAGDDPVRPGDRVLAYDADAMLGAYRNVLAAAVADAPSPRHAGGRGDQP